VDLGGHPPDACGLNDAAGELSDAAVDVPAEASLDGALETAPPEATVDAVADATATDAAGTDGAADVAAETTAPDADATDDSPVEAASRADAGSTCTDGVVDGDESDVDCGGSCPGCSPHKRCYVDADCSATASGCDTASGGCFCDATATLHACVYSHCYDAKVSGDETGVDCGGSTCGPCPTGMPCRNDSDCTTMACDAHSLRCVANQCSDHRLDGMESDIDCGGLYCGPCLVGQVCLSSFDCQSGHVCASTNPRVCM
jgi:hypothetical protein